MTNKKIDKNILIIYLDQIIFKLNTLVQSEDWEKRINGGVNDGCFYVVRYLCYESFLISLNRFIEMMSISKERKIENISKNPFILWYMDFIFKRHDSPDALDGELKNFYDHFFTHGFKMDDCFYEENNKKMWEKIFGVSGLTDEQIVELEDTKENFCFHRKPIAKFLDITESDFSNLLKQHSIIERASLIKIFFEKIKIDVEKWNGEEQEKQDFVINKDSLWEFYKDK